MWEPDKPKSVYPPWYIDTSVDGQVAVVFDPDKVLIQVEVDDDGKPTGRRRLVLKK